MAVETEMDEFLHRHERVLTLEGERVVVRNGHNPERTIQVGIGEVSVCMPKVRDRSLEGDRLSFVPGAPISSEDRKSSGADPSSLAEGDLHGTDAGGL